VIPLFSLWIPWSEISTTRCPIPPPLGCRFPRPLFPLLLPRFFGEWLSSFHVLPPSPSQEIRTFFDWWRYKRHFDFLGVPRAYLLRAGFRSYFRIFRTLSPTCFFFDGWPFLTTRLLTNCPLPSLFRGFSKRFSPRIPYHISLSSTNFVKQFSK